MGNGGIQMGVGPWVRAACWGTRACWLLLAIALALGLSGALTPFSASAEGWAPPRTVFVPTTGHTTDGLFLDLWRVERALLGDPISEEFRPRTGFAALGEDDIIQFYENLALIYVPDAAPGDQVQALDLGRQALDDARSSGMSIALGRALERTVCAPATNSSCVNVVEAGHTVRGPFLTYWSAGSAASWLGSPLSESFLAPDRTRVQYFENGILRQNAEGEVTPLPLGEIAAEEAQVDTTPMEQPTEVPVYDEGLWVAPPEAEATPSEASEMDWAFGPGPQQGTWKEIVVSVSAQSMWAYEGGELLVSSLVSTGTAEVPETTTPVGYHAVLAKFDAQTMEGTISGDYYRVEDVPYVMYFDDFGNAIHGTYWHNNFGAPMSHGCVNLPMDIAAWMYDWAPVGTAVTVVA